jgi:predicted ATPase
VLGTSSAPPGWEAQLEPELLAHHLTQGGDPERAIGYWQAAAQRASERSAHHEAVAHLRKSVELLRELPETGARDRLELQLQISLGSALIVIHGYSSAAAEDVYERARELVERCKRSIQLGPALRRGQQGISLNLLSVPVH